MVEKRNERRDLHKSQDVPRTPTVPTQKKESSRKDFQEWLRPLVKRSSFSITELAKRARMNYSHVHGLVHGKKDAGPWAVQRLAQALNCSPEETVAGFEAACLEPEVTVPACILMEFPVWDVQMAMNFEPLSRKEMAANIQVMRGGELTPFKLALTVTEVRGESRTVLVEAKGYHRQLLPPATYRFDFRINDEIGWSFELSPPDSQELAAELVQRRLRGGS